MKSNIDRRQDIFHGVIPDMGSDAYEKLVSHLSSRVQSPEEKKIIKDCFTKARNSLEAQYLSHSDFITEVTLRHFLLEYNSRAWEHGLRSMPMLFNIMESYFRYHKPHIYFELLEEENYLISFFDFLDFITSNEFSENKSLITENLVEDIIYNFNIGSDLAEIKIKTDNDIEFIVAGLSIIRRGNEVTILLISGSNEKRSTDDIKIELNTEYSNKRELLEKYKKDTQGQKQQPLYIDEQESYAKTLVICRLDLQTETIDARYIAEEYEHSFSVQTDEIDTFIDHNGDYRSPKYEEIHKKGVKKVTDYNALFEVIKSSLYLPYYLNTFEESLLEESHETEFKKANSHPIKKRKFKDTFGYKASIKPLYVLNKDNKFSPDNIKLRDDLFKIETSGFWKKLGVDEVGLDKKGNPIHGKSWVNKKLSWYEGKQDELVITKEKERYKGVNAGFIYIMRNPSMGQNIFKIGLTKKDVENRAKQLSKTSVPDKFYKAQEWNVKDCVKAEKRIHDELVQYRVDPRREFFDLEYSKATEVISRICDEINKKDA